MMVRNSLTTCHLDAADQILRTITPPLYIVGLFGSSLRCTGAGECISRASDLDLLLCHPPGLEEEALTIRREAYSRLQDLALLPDITILSDGEILSTGFWESERVTALRAHVARCSARSSSPPANWAPHD